jgi:mono/diheme cytochrome c family protein
VAFRAWLLAAVLLAVPPSPAPARADDGADLRARGELVFNAGGCTNCHTAKDGPPLAGGDAIQSPYGAFYAPNITPDPKTGIGGWSEADFVRAMREGRAPDGSAYYPAFPYTSYTRMTDDDLRALKAYLDTVPPVDRPSRPHELWFPFDQRWGMRLWQWAFFVPGRFEPDPARDAAWNRGAYLVQGPGHCQECHTPRTFYGVLEEDRAFAGGRLGKERVPNLTGDPEVGLGKWSESDIGTVLKLGMTPEGDFVGSDMAKVVNNATGKLPDEDIAAIAGYIKTLPPRR